MKYLLLLLLIFNLFIFNPIDNLILFLLWIFILSIILYINHFYFITWIILIIYGSALVILFTYVLMIKFKSYSFYSIYKFKYFKFTPLFFIFLLFSLFKFDFYHIYSSYSFNDSYSIMNYIFNIQPLFIIFLFIQLLFSFIILIFQ